MYVYTVARKLLLLLIIKCLTLSIQILPNPLTINVKPKTLNDKEKCETRAFVDIQYIYHGAKVTFFLHEATYDTHKVFLYDTALFVFIVAISLDSSTQTRFL